MRATRKGEVDLPAPAVPRDLGGSASIGDEPVERAGVMPADPDAV